MKNIVLIMICTSILLGCNNDNSRQSMEEQNIALIKKIHAEVAKGNIEFFEQSLHPNYVRHCQAMPPELQELTDKDIFVGFVKEYAENISNYGDSIGPIIASGDMVAYVSTMSGTQTGPIGDLPASGKDFRLVNIIIQRIEDGKVAETWISWDNVAMLSQLGFFPPPQPSNSES